MNILEKVIRADFLVGRSPSQLANDFVEVLCSLKVLFILRDSVVLVIQSAKSISTHSRIPKLLFLSRLCIIAT